MKKDNRRMFSRLAAVALMAAAGVSPVVARQLDPQEALQRAVVSDSNSSVRRAPAQRSLDKMKLVYTGLSKSGVAPALYVFAPSEADGGFLIASADSRLRPVLAVADSGSFNAAEMPENLSWWLSQYQEEISAYLATEPAETADSDGEMTVCGNYQKWTPIAPIVTTKWNQDNPYNALCPVYNGQRTVTGCSATAMAQVVKAIGFYDGKGSRSYTSSAIKVDVSFNFAEWKCDFSKMFDVYDNNTTQEQVDQVANLMLACGVAINTNYNLASVGGSGAGYPVNGLVQYFGYDEASVVLERVRYKSTQWESIIYDQLSQGRPLYYAGSGNGAHAFVCDGYSSDGFFHFNWGWGGMSDGYYALSALNPKDQGIGSFEGGYNLSQVIGIFVKPGAPKPENIISTSAPYGLVYQGELAAPSMSKTIDTFNFFHTLSYTPDGQSRNVGVSLLLEPADGGEEIFVKPRSYNTIGIFSSSQSQFSVRLSSSNVPAGTYYAYPAFCIKNEEGYWKAYHYYGSSTDHFVLTLNEDGSRTYVPAIKRNPGIEIYDMAVNGIYTGASDNLFTALITNYSSEDFSENISLRVETTSGTAVAKIATNAIAIRAGETMPVSARFAGKNLRTGKLVFKIYRESTDTQLGENSLTVTAKSGSRPGGKDEGPQGQCEVALWSDGAYTALAPAGIEVGGTFSGVTALCPYSAQSLSYSLAFFPKGQTSGALCSYPVATRQLKSSYWVEGDAFSVTPNLPVGNYTMAFVDDKGVLLSYPVDFSVMIGEGGVLYHLNDDGATLAAANVSDSELGDFTIPAAINYQDKSYPVSSLAENLFSGRFDLTEITLPASLTSIGLNAFRGATALQRVWFNAPVAPFANSALAFFSVNPKVECYVAAENYEAYSPVYHSVGHLYAVITSLSAPESSAVAEGSEAEVALTVVPAAHFNPDYTVEVDNPDVLSATAKGSTLRLTGLKQGSASVTLTSAQPGVAPVKVNVTVTEPEENGINEIEAADSASNVIYDLQGRRVTCPSRGLYIINGTKTHLR